jgi:hypothetical protein
MHFATERDEVSKDESTPVSNADEADDWAVVTLWASSVHHAKSTERLRLCADT